MAFALIGFQGSFRDFYTANLVLALICSAIAHIIGALAGGDKKLAAESLPALFTPQILFSGFFITPSLIPVWIRWLQYLSPLTYVIRILLVSEFTECSDIPEVALYCEYLLTTVEAKPEDVWWYWLILFCQFLTFRALALFLLRSSAQRFY
jgi:ABC-type multidrug transport system permease subunit